MRNLGILILLLPLACCKYQQHDKTQQSTNDTTNLLLKVDSGLEVKKGKNIKFTSQYNFKTFPAKVYEGAMAKPDFSNNEFANDKSYVKFIEDGCKQKKINFGGHYTIIQKTCGAMCSSIFVVDRINGKIFTDIKPNDGRYGYLYEKSSKLLIANSNLFQNDSLKYYNNRFGDPELYVWTGNNFKSLQ